MTGHPSIDPARIYHFEMQTITLFDFPASGPILDIGGGGEGTIGRIKGNQVVAVDPNRRELEEAPPGPLKIVMDAAALLFLDNTFPTATAFCSFMYMPKEVRTQVMAEVYRVLTPGGIFTIWDMLLPPRVNENQDVAVFPLMLALPNGEEISTGYGVLWPREGRTEAYYAELSLASGFELLEQTQDGSLMVLKLRKPV